MNKNKTLFICILIGIIASFILLFNRVNVESKNKSVDFTLDYEEISKLAAQSEEDLSWWFRKFKELKVGSVSLNEETFESLINEYNPLEMELIGNIVKDLDWREKQPKELVDYIEEKDVTEYDLVVTTNSESLYDFIHEGLNKRYDRDKFNVLKFEDKYIFILEGKVEDALYTKSISYEGDTNKPYVEKRELSDSKLMRLGLGYDEEKIEKIQDAGLEVNLRPFNYNPSWISEKYIQANFAEYDNYQIQPKYMLFTGMEVLGYPEHTDLVRDYIKDNNIKIGLIESGVQRGHLKQEGLDDLVKDLDYNAIRVFSIPGYIQERYKHYNYDGAEEIENTLYRAVTERNIRLIYFRPFKYNSHSYVTNPKDYEDTFHRLEERIGKHGMTLGEGSVMESNDINKIFMMLIGLGILAAGIILMDSIINISRKLKYLGLLIGAIGIIIVNLIAPYTSLKLFALGAAVVFPTLSMVYMSNKLKDYYLEAKVNNNLSKSIIEAIKILLIMVSISLIGGIFVASLLSGTEYLLEMDIFRGVKIAQIIPILLYVLIFIGYFGYKEDKKKDETRIDLKDLKDILIDNIKIIYAIMAALILGIGYIYLARTGHETNVQPSNLEMMTRNFLELKFLARPRNKEFLIAFPAIFLVVYMGMNKRKIEIFILGLLIIIGQTSIVNSFSHLRTPVYISLARTLYGIIIGIVVGILYLVVLKLVVKLFKALKGEMINE